MFVTLFVVDASVPLVSIGGITLVYFRILEAPRDFLFDREIEEGLCLASVNRFFSGCDGKHTSPNTSSTRDCGMPWSAMYTQPTPLKAS